MILDASKFPDIVSAVSALPDGSTLYLPAERGPYYVPEDVTLDFSRFTQFQLRGDGFCGGHADGSAIIGNVDGDLIRRSGTGTGHSFRMQDFTVRNVHPNGTAVRVNNVNTSKFDHVQFMGFRGLVAEANIFTLVLDCCKFNGVKAPGSIGLISTSHTSVRDCDVAGWGDGIRACGTTCNVTGGRFEVNWTAIRLGVNPDGQPWLLGRSVLEGFSMEANDTAIDLTSVVGVTLKGIGIQGSVNSPSHQSQLGIIDRMSKKYGVEAVLVGGMFAEAAVRFLKNPNRQTQWTLCEAKNGFPGGKDWDIPIGAGTINRVLCN